MIEKRAVQPRALPLRADGSPSLNGKALLLNFWSSTCVPCVAETAVLQSLYQRQRAQGLVVVGNRPRDREAAIEYARWLSGIADGAWPPGS